MGGPSPTAAITDTLARETKFRDRKDAMTNIQTAVECLYRWGMFSPPEQQSNIKAG